MCERESARASERDRACDCVRRGCDPLPCWARPPTRPPLHAASEDDAEGDHALLHPKALVPAHESVGGPGLMYSPSLVLDRGNISSFQWYREVLRVTQGVCERSHTMVRDTDMYIAGRMSLATTVRERSHTSTTYM